jgi:pimeloyl-ACP methyl ester carboxylesterase
VVLLLHSFPAPSFLYRDLMERLAGTYRVAAPDYPGFGYSDSPPTTQFSYTFDRLATFVQKFTYRLGLESDALYMQDFGGPVGFRVASHRPERVSALIVQNANAYEAGLPESFWAPARALWKDPSAANFDRIRELAMSDAALERNYTHGVREPERINPDNWILQRGLLSRPGNKDAMLALLNDYGNNLALYDAWQEYFRKSQPPALVVWGKNDQTFPAEGARAYVRDLPRAELHLLDTGHFALEDKGTRSRTSSLTFSTGRFETSSSAGNRWPACEGRPAGRLSLPPSLGVKGAPSGDHLRVVGFHPLLDRLHELAERHAESREPVLDMRRHFVVVDAPDDAVAFEVAQHLRQHLLRDPVDLAPQRARAHGTCTKRAKEQHGPFAADQL